MSNENRIISGSIIGLRKEFEDQFMMLYKHAFPGVVERICRSNISDYSIFLHNNILFSYMVYAGTDYEADMKAIGSDKTTQEWGKLIEPMHQPFKSKQENERWADIKLWYSTELHSLAPFMIVRYTYTLPTPASLPETAPDQLFGDIDFWGTTYDLKSLKIFRGFQDLYIYLETSQTADLSFLLEIITRVLKADTLPAVMIEVFHTECINSD